MTNTSGAKASGCRPEHLSRLLQEQLTPEETAQLATHLDACPACQQKLETLAGDDVWWSDASQFLQPLPGDTGGATASVADRHRLEPLDENADDGWQGIVEETFLADFAIHYLDPADNPTLLGKLGEYEILELIGRGGMGVVFKGFDRELNRYVAVKVLAPHLALNAAARKRFAREAQAAAAVVHPHVVAIHSVNGLGRLPYFVMPYIAGESLQQRIDRTGPLDVREVLRISMQAARGLAAAHEQGLVHRDVKPGNILLERGVDRVLLTDFGLARTVDDATLTRSGMIAGTPQYMSPEQARGDSVEARSDLFSLGSVMYAMCTGHPPFRAETTMGVLRRITDTVPRPVHDSNPYIPGWCAGIIDKLLRKFPDERFANAMELSELLSQCLAHLQQPTLIPLPREAADLAPRYARNWTRKWLKRMTWSGAVCLVLGLSVWGGLAWWATQGTSATNVEATATADPPVKPAETFTSPQEQLEVVLEDPLAQPPPTQPGMVQVPPGATADVTPLATKTATVFVAPTTPEPPWNDGLETDLQRLNLDVEALSTDIGQDVQQLESATVPGGQAVPDGMSK